MIGDLAAILREQVDANRQFLRALQAQVGRQAQALEKLAARPAAVPHTQWPAAVGEWPVRLLPLLAGEAQTAAMGLPPVERRVYDDIKRAMVDRLELLPEDHRRRFREARLGPGD